MMKIKRVIKILMQGALLVIFYSILTTACSIKNEVSWYASTRNDLEKVAADINSTLKPWVSPGH